MIRGAASLLVLAILESNGSLDLLDYGKGFSTRINLQGHRHKRPATKAEAFCCVNTYRALALLSLLPPVLLLPSAAAAGSSSRDEPLLLQFGKFVSLFTNAGRAGPCGDTAPTGAVIVML